MSEKSIFPNGHPASGKDQNGKPHKPVEEAAPKAKPK
jgi:hypothetical protein